MSKHRRPIDEPTIAFATRFAAAAMTAAIIAGGGALAAGPAYAVQDGVTTAPDAPQSGVFDTGPGAIPDPPKEAPYRDIPTYDAPTYVEPSYNQGPSYNDTPTYNAPIVNTRPAPTPQRQAPVNPQVRPGGPVRPILPPKGYLRIGKFITKDTGPLTRAQVNSINRYAAYGEAKIAQGLIAAGISPREADRQAASTIIGVVIGGGVGAATLGIPLAIVGGLGGAAIGAGIGAFVPPQPLNIGTGALIGAGSGAALLGLGGAAAGAGIGGTIGGVIGYILGAGDPKANPTLPGQDPAAPPAPLRKAAPLPNPGAAQYTAVLPKAQARAAGLPAVDYTVSTRGDVDATATIGGRDYHVGITKEQADAPFKALGGLEKPAREFVDRTTRDLSAATQRAIPGLKIAYPQTIPAHAAPKAPAGHGGNR